MCVTWLHSAENSLRKATAGVELGVSVAYETLGLLRTQFYGSAGIVCFIDTFKCISDTCDFASAAFSQLFASTINLFKT